MASHKRRQVFSLRSPDSRMPRLVASFDTRLSRSTLSSSYSVETTTVHPILVPSPLHRSHQEGSAFRGSAGSCAAFFYPGDRLPSVTLQRSALVPASCFALHRLSESLLGVLLDWHVASDFHDFASYMLCNDISAFDHYLLTNMP